MRPSDEVPISDIINSFDYNNFEPLFGSEFPSDPSQLIDFDQLSEIEDISSKESIPEITNAPHPGFSNSHGLLGRTNLGSLLGSYTDSNRNVWRDANGELKTNDDKARYPIIRDAQSETSSPLNVDTDDIITYMHLPGSQQNAVPIYFHQLTLSPDDTSDQHGNAEQNNMGNKHFSDNLIVPDYRKIPMNDQKQTAFDYNNFEPLFGSEFPSDPSQLIDFDQLSEIEDISSKESIPEITNAPHPGFSKQP
ncbi:Uncharacterized protein BM_BM17247, partial [Brugia malayi]